MQKRSTKEFSLSQAKDSEIPSGAYLVIGDLI